MGWSDTNEGQTRVLSNGNATVTVHPWTSLGGQTADQWLRSFVNTDPKGGTLISSQEIKPETVSGAYSVLRQARFGGQKGLAVLYACPGRSGEARLMSLDVKNGSITEAIKGANLGEGICKKEIAALGQTASPQMTPAAPVATGPDTGRDPARLNSKIPNGLRPTKAELYTDWVLKGFPAIRTLTLEMVLQFPDGTRLACSDWAPDGSVPLRRLAAQKDCQVSGDRSKDAIYGFKPGQTIDIKFGRISGFSIDGLEGSAGALSGGDLVMNSRGQIALGSWQVGRLSTRAASAKATNIRKRGLVGNYHLNGHTITIVSNQGNVVHGLIGYSRNGNGQIDTIYLNGKWYRDRDS